MAKTNQATATELICRRCSHPQSWHRHDDACERVGHPQPCYPETAPFRCLGYNCMRDDQPTPAGTPESRCGCPDYVENCDGC
jgi:hypothetical protein